jgi:Rps23 Pro-64 3,4-dihydroxylase Tpa1-like proline 4-hydroxylase
VTSAFGTAVATPEGAAWTRHDLASTMVRRLSSDGDRLRQAFHAPSGTNTRHFVYDDFLPEEIAREVGRAFPADCRGFKRRDDFRERKLTSVLLDDLAPILKEITFAFQSPEVIAAIGRLTNISTLEPDPKLYAGGLSIMVKGDYLHPHIDNSHDSERSRYRRLNILYYVSPNWTEANGGNFELWNDTVRKPKLLVSRFNRLVVMETNRTSHHSVNEVLVDKQRCCVSNYFFSKDSPTGEDYYHVTAFKGRPENLWMRAVFAADAAARNVAARVFGAGRGRNTVYRPKQG